MVFGVAPPKYNVLVLTACLKIYAHLGRQKIKEPVKSNDIQAKFCTLVPYAEIKNQL